MAMTCPECNGLGEITEPVAGTIATRRNKLERGWRRQWLIKRLAQGETTQQTLANACGVAQSAIAAFRKRHEDAILAERARMGDELSALWIADKLARLAEYQSDVEEINDIVDSKVEASTPQPWNPLDPANDGKATPSAIDDLPVWLRVKAGILRSAAEELGQIPQRVNVQVGGTLVTYKIEGVDMEALR